MYFIQDTHTATPSGLQKFLWNVHKANSMASTAHLKRVCLSGKNSCSGLSLPGGTGPAAPGSPCAPSVTPARVPASPVTLTPSTHRPTGDSQGFGKVWFLLWGKSSTSDAPSGWQNLLSPGAQGHRPWVGRAAVGQGGPERLQLPGVDCACLLTARFWSTEAQLLEVN